MGFFQEARSQALQHCQAWLTALTAGSPGYAPVSGSPGNAGSALLLNPCLLYNMGQEHGAAILPGGVRLTQTEGEELFTSKAGKFFICI